MNPVAHHKWSTFRRWLLAGWLGCLTLLGAAPPARAYVLDGQHWPLNRPVVLDLHLGALDGTLADGSATWDQVAQAAVDLWNPYLGSGVRLTTTENAVVPTRSDDHNSVFFGPTVFGEAFGDDTVGITVTYYNPRTNEKLEADVIFNTAKTFNSYRGPIRYAAGGAALADLRRVALHEFGHLLGLGHTAQSAVSIMRPAIGDLDTLQNDDIAGVQAIYGVPTTVTPVTPTPTPAPAALPVVSVAATTPQVVVGSGGKGVFTVSLSETQPADVVVRYVLKGSAVNGTDYALLGGSKKIKAGQTQRKIKVVPGGDLRGLDRRTVKLKVTADAAYTTGAPASAKVKILAEP